MPRRISTPNKDPYQRLSSETRRNRCFVRPGTSSANEDLPSTSADDRDSVVLRGLPDKWDLGNLPIVLLTHRSQFPRCDKCSSVSVKTFKFVKCDHVVCETCTSSSSTSSPRGCPSCQTRTKRQEQVLEEDFLQVQRMKCQKCSKTGNLDDLKAHLPCTRTPRRGNVKNTSKRNKTRNVRLVGMSKGAIRRLARRGGVKRISGLLYEEARAILRTFIANVLRNAITYADYGKRNTVTGLDVVRSLNMMGRTLYGFYGFKK